LRDNVETVKRHTGKQLRGMLGPAGSTTPNTMRLMAEAGLAYTADWLIDDQPFPIVTESGRWSACPTPARSTTTR